MAYVYCVCLMFIWFIMESSLGRAAFKSLLLFTLFPWLVRPSHTEQRHAHKDLIPDRELRPRLTPLVT